MQALAAGVDLKKLDVQCFRLQLRLVSHEPSLSTISKVWQCRHHLLHYNK